ncbi:hypothetical protein [Oceaniradius stylonematis]|uniref:hypothetical protein n=1 Tax=Oceaniradius stylonematis TaxID=2184161 RepID=UPI00273D194D|nr:hypothetical protein [Oceaniradius stylonematis]
MNPSQWQDVTDVLCECDAAWQIGDRFLIVGSHLTGHRFTVTDMATDAPMPGDTTHYEGDDWQSALDHLS